MQEWRVIEDGPQDGESNMAIDRAILASCASGKTLPTLRLYSWEQPTLTVGYAQDFAKEIDVNTIGTMTKDEGGLSYDMWAGSKRNIIQDYLKNIPINKQSDLAIELFKKILLSNADVPESEKDNEDFLLIRINKLIELGDFDNAKSLIDLIVNKDNEEILMKQAQINLSLNDFDLVCSNI